MVFLKGGERDLFPFNKSELLTLSSYLLRRLLSMSGRESKLSNFCR